MKYIWLAMLVALLVLVLWPNQIPDVVFYSALAIIGMLFVCEWRNGGFK